MRTKIDIRRCESYVQATVFAHVLPCSLLQEGHPHPFNRFNGKRSKTSPCLLHLSLIAVLLFT